MGALLQGLGIEWAKLIAQLVSFALLIALLWVVAYKPFLRMMDQRSAKVKESMEQAQQVREQSAHAEEELKKQVDAGRKESQELIARAMKAGDEVKQKAQEDAKKEAEAALVKARTDIQRERDQAIGEIRKEFADLTINAAEKVINKSLDKTAHRDLIDKVLQESKPKQG